jgi:hypothetical protein
MRVIRLAFVLLLSFIIAGCATTAKTGLSRNSEKIELNNESLLIITAELSNEYKITFQPEASALQLESQNAGQTENTVLRVDSDAIVPGTDVNTYVFRGLVKPGKYVVRGISGTSNHFPIMGSFFIPLHCEVEIAAGKVIDLGKVTAVVRERTGNEFRAGPITPLIDQAIAGFSGGTFDVQISPHSGADAQRLKSLFPALRGATIVAQTMPPFNRDKAQKWWETHF